jgi:hypothetical protein
MILYTAGEEMHPLHLRQRWFSKQFVVHTQACSHFAAEHAQHSPTHRELPVLIAVWRESRLTHLVFSCLKSSQPLQE